MWQILAKELAASDWNIVSNHGTSTMTIKPRAIGRVIPLLQIDKATSPVTYSVIAPAILPCKLTPTRLSSFATHAGA